MDEPNRYVSIWIDEVIPSQHSCTREKQDNAEDVPDPAEVLDK